MTKEIKTSIIIQASTETIWNILTDFESYPTWNPFIQSIQGDVQVGNKISIQLQGMKFKPKVLVFKENTEFRWLGHLGFKGLFDGEHSFVLTPKSNDVTLFEQNETFNGSLVPLFSKSLNKTKIGFEQMNQKLKERAES